MKKILTIEGMSCGHCVSRVEKTLKSIDGVTEVVVDLGKKTALIEANVEIEDGLLNELIDEAGYDVISIDSI